MAIPGALELAHNRYAPPLESSRRRDILARGDRPDSIASAMSYEEATGDGGCVSSRHPQCAAHRRAGEWPRRSSDGLAATLGLDARCGLGPGSFIARVAAERGAIGRWTNSSTKCRAAYLAPLATLFFPFSPTHASVSSSCIRRIGEFASLPRYPAASVRSGSGYGPVRSHRATNLRDARSANGSFPTVLAAPAASSHRSGRGCSSRRDTDAARSPHPQLSDRPEEKSRFFRSIDLTAGTRRLPRRRSARLTCANRPPILSAATSLFARSGLSPRFYLKVASLSFRRARSSEPARPERAFRKSAFESRPNRPAGARYPRVSRDHRRYRVASEARVFPRDEPHIHSTSVACSLLPVEGWDWSTQSPRGV